MNRDRSRSPRRGGGDDRRRGGGGGGVSDRGGRFDPHSDKMVYITNLPYEMSWMDLKDVIRDKGGEVSFVEVLKTKEGKSKGVAVVEFASKESSQKTIEVLHRESVHGRVISAKEIRDPGAFFRRIKEESGIDFLSNRERRPERAPFRERRSSPVLRSSNETYGLSSSFLDSLNLKPPLVNRVFVTNLDKEGKTKGMAIVEFSHPIEAVQAISMLHNQRLFDRTITVKMDRFEKDPDRDRQGLPNGLRGVGMGLGANGSPLSDIASLIGQIGQPQPFQSNGNGHLSSPQVPQAQSFPAFQQTQPTSTQVGSVFDSSPYGNSVNSSPFVANSVPQRQVSPAPANYYGQQTQPAYGVPSDPNQPVYPKQSNYSATYDRKPAAIHQPSYQTPPQPRSAQGTYISSYDHPTRVVLIKNLPHDYTWDVIAQRLRQFGDFESVELVSSGVAKVTFRFVSDAERSKATLHNTLVENNVIAVEYILQ